MPTTNAYNYFAQTPRNAQKYFTAGCTGTGTTPALALRQLLATSLESAQFAEPSRKQPERRATETLQTQLVAPAILQVSRDK